MTAELVPLSTNMWDSVNVQVIKNTVARGITDDELVVFLHTCVRTGLDPLLKQIYAIPRKSKDANGQWTTKMVIQTAIDGYRLIAERTGKYSPGREPTYTYDNNGRLVSATSYVKKMTDDGTWHEISATAFWNEYVQTNKEGVPTDFWRRMPHGQLAKCAESLALRKAFPAQMSNVRTFEEMEQADNDPEALPQSADVQVLNSAPSNPVAAPAVQENKAEEVEENAEQITNWMYAQGDDVAGWFDSFGLEKVWLIRWMQFITKSKKITKEEFVKSFMKDHNNKMNNMKNWIEWQKGDNNVQPKK